MKNRMLVLLAAVMMALSFVACDTDEGGGNDFVKNDYADVIANETDEVQKCFLLTNWFRASKEAYYLNSDNKTTTNLVGKLSALTLDEELCKAAQIRANEIVKNFSHTRPNGNSCFTVLKDLSISYGTAGENIAAGNQSGEKTFLQWKEDDEDYAGQGHRRNMLGTNYKRIGIAYTYDAGSTYRYYWVMILTN